jgi:ribosome-associated protein
MDKELLRASLEETVLMTFSRSSGAGGQNVNKVNTKVTASLPLENLQGLDDFERERLKEKLSNRINESNELLIQVQDERSQLKNRQIALERLFLLIEDALKIPKKRRKTRPGRAAREKRLKSKRHNKEKKSLRRPVSLD